MAQAASDFLEDKILDLFTGNNITAPAQLYVGLLTALPGDTGSGGAPSDGTEVTSANGYARVSVGTMATWLSAKSTVNTSQRHRTNANQINFPAATGSWGTVVGYGLWDAASGGNLWAYGAITSQAITNGMTPDIPAGPGAGCIDLGVD